MQKTEQKFGPREKNKPATRESFVKDLAEIFGRNPKRDMIKNAFNPDRKPKEKSKR